MSLIASNWARVQIIHRTPKAVLMHIATFANQRDGYYCFPGQKKIADGMGYSERTVRDALQYLEAMGFIEREQRRRKDGYRSSDTITLCVDDMPVVVKQTYPEWRQERRSHRQLSQPHRQFSPISPAPIAGRIKEGDQGRDQRSSLEAPGSSTQASSAESARELNDRLLAQIAREAIPNLPGLSDEAFFNAWAGVKLHSVEHQSPELKAANLELIAALDAEAERRFGVSFGDSK